MTAERIAELRELARSARHKFWANFGEALDEALDALEASRAELKRIADDKAYLYQANVANEWEERYQSQERRLEAKGEELAVVRAQCAAMRKALEDIRSSVGALSDFMYEPVRVVAQYIFAEIHKALHPPASAPIPPVENKR